MVCADFVPPAYDGRSLSGVLPAVAAALGAGDGFEPTTLRLPEARAYVVLLIDGLGYELLAEHPDEAPFLHSHLGAPATVGVPSTTATSLTSLGTGLPPGAHGVVGFTSRVPGTGRLLNALAWDRSVDAEQWQPHATAYERLAHAGLSPTVVSRRAFAGTGLTVAGQRGASYVAADHEGEQLVAVVAAAREPRSVTYTYDPDLDWTGHRYGVGSPQWRVQLGVADAAAERLHDALPSGTALVVVADHGMVDCPLESRVDVDAVPALRSGVALLGGEARFRHVYCSSGAVADVAATWREVLGPRAEVLTRQEAVDAGWFGQVTPAVRPRLGDVVVAARGDHAVVSTADFPYEQQLLGLHGSLTAREMLIPLLVTPS